MGRGSGAGVLGRNRARACGVGEGNAADRNVHLSSADLAAAFAFDFVHAGGGCADDGVDGVAVERAGWPPQRAPMVGGGVTFAE